MDTASEIRNYFNQKTVLITGATGFVGTLLVEKILRTCDIHLMYITIRPKKNKSVEQRLEEHFDDPVYDRLKSERCDVFNKIRTVSADLGLPDLGISEFDRQLIVKGVNVVFHAAATTRFDEKIRIATNINVRGTLEIMKMCTQMENLQSIVHVSTAYSFCVRPDIEEKFYETKLTSVNLLGIVEALDDDTLGAITPVLLEQWPNTYVFTKSVAEGTVREYSNILPLAMVRPTMITATDRDPLPGWTNTLIGPTGVLLGCGMGIIRTQHYKPEYICDFIPADHVVNCMIAAAASFYKHDQRQSPKEGGHIYNCVTSSQSPLTWEECGNIGKKEIAKIPPTASVWRIFFVGSPHRQVFLILHYILHLIPAYIIDFFAICVGQQPRMVKVYAKVYQLLDVLSYFTTHQWNFSNGNTQNLWRNLNPHDRECYNFDAGSIDWVTYFYKYTCGARVYILKDPLDTVPQGRQKQLRLKIAHYTLMSIFIFLFIYIFKCMIILMYN